MRLSAVVAAAAACFLTAGCGNSPIIFPKTATVRPYHTVGCDATAPTVQTNSQFSVQTSESELNLYPGGSGSIEVSVPVTAGASSQQVQVAADHMPVGLRVFPVQTSSGNTVTLKFYGGLPLAFNCFVGGQGTYTATIPVAITANGAGGTASTNINLNVVLENPSFKPATTDLPVMKLDTADGSDITSKDDYVEGSVELTDAADGSHNFQTTTQVKGHGNSTWDMPKKPYSLKLDSKEKLLGMASSKHWILLANYDDKTMMRNALALYLSQMFQMEWTPNSKFVELYLNGTYEGVYEVTEKVEIDSNRLNIDELDDTDNSGTALTGGYLMEIDAYLGATFCFKSPRNLPICSDDPDPPTTEQANYIQGVVTDAENSLFSSSFTNTDTGWPAHFDRSTLVDWFIVEELMGNQDGNFYSSDYFYKKRNDPLLYMGPVWDFDITSGNTQEAIVDPTEPWIRTQAIWYARLFQDPAFVAAVKARWTEIRPQVGNIPTFIDTTAASLQQGQANNYQRWPTLYDRVWPNAVAYGNYGSEVSYLKTWMAQRVAYMDKNYLNQ